MRLLDDDGEEWIERLEMGIDIFFFLFIRFIEDYWFFIVFVFVRISM